MRQRDWSGMRQRDWSGMRQRDWSGMRQRDWSGMRQRRKTTAHAITTLLPYIRNTVLYTNKQWFKTSQHFAVPRPVARI